MEIKLIKFLAVKASKHFSFASRSNVVLVACVSALYLAHGLAAAHSSAPPASSTATQGFNEWLEFAATVAEQKLLANVSPADARLGAIVASPSRENPDYYFHWVRDAALIVETMLDLRERSQNTAYRNLLAAKIMAFAEFTRFTQPLPALGGIGEPKYHIDGQPFRGPWARPQNDGPALRVRALLRAEQALNTNLWAIIRVDLEYIAATALDPSWDLWEEIYGYHFYTQLQVLEALEQGAIAAEHQGDTRLALALKAPAPILRERIKEHFAAASGRRYIVENLRLGDGIAYKSTGLDAATILAILHLGSSGASWFSESNVLRSLIAMERAFAREYALNQSANDFGVAIGRYPEDRYYGGNPWFLTTSAFAEFYYRLAARALASGSEKAIADARYFRERGDAYLRRVREHSARDGSQSEQFDRNNGFMLSAEHLTWSYSAYLRAYWARAALNLD